MALRGLPLKYMKAKQSFSIDRQLLDQAKEAAKKERRSLSSIVDMALFAYLNPSPTIARFSSRTTKKPA